MRKIKFRAWDKENKCMDDDFYLDNSGMAFEMAGTVYDTPHIEIESKDDLEIMQYIGLKDKDGKEIFEGDIIEIKNPHKQRHYMGTVLYGQYSFYVYGFYFGHFDAPTDIFSEGTEFIEIVGNIHENPELIKD